MTRPEYVKCIMHTHRDLRPTAWCGRWLGNVFSFVDIDHAVYTVGQGQRLLPCRACVKAIVDILTYDGPAIVHQFKKES